jgi:hypothetical protein
VIPAESPDGSVTVTAVNDDIYEGTTDETVIVGITSVTNGTAGTPGQVTVSIVDNESQPTVTLDAPTSPISENGGTSEITARLSGAADENVEVTILHPNAGSAEPTDYTLGTLIVITAGDLTGSLTLAALDDADADDEDVDISITNVDGPASEQGQQTATVTITDDDGA